MAKKKITRQAKTQKKKIMQNIIQPLDTKGNVQNTLVETGKDLIIGVVGGGFAGAAIGKPSLIIGIISSGAGHYLNNRLLVSFGMGMMASNGFQSKSLKGVDGMEDMKERLETYKANFLQKTYVEKLKGLKKPTSKTTEGIGEVQYFTYPQNALEGAEDGYDMLNRIEQQIANQGLQLSQMSGMEDLEGIGSLNAVQFEEAIY